MHRFLIAMLPAMVACSTHAPDPNPPTLRVATYNTSLFAEHTGGLIRRLETGDVAARRIAAVIQHQRPDIVLLNEFDHDDAGRAADLFQQRYLETPQFGLQPIRYPYRFSAPVNTGVPSGADFNRDGTSEGPEDAYGYGTHAGQYGMLLLSMHPIDPAAARTFQTFLWKDMPDALAPLNPIDNSPWYDSAAWSIFRLSSKSHWDVPVDTPLGRIHLLAAHPTPPVFDGPEDRNGRRNHDELRFWRDYLTPESADYIYDDAGQRGGLDASESFVLLGDLNADPELGAGRHDSIRALLAHPRVQAEPAPRHSGRRAVSTSFFGDRTDNLRVDYVLPSRDLRVLANGVFWPQAGETGAEWIGASDHRMVWLEVSR
jgi:endonuclease/exonuclease/phosphatase family metal-dependent hydrolase